MAQAAGQTWSTDGYVANARFVATLAADLIDDLAPEAGEAVLDLGCGDGYLTAAIAARGARVVALDPAPDLIATARRRGLPAVLGDARALPFKDRFDAVFSNAALHWVPDHPAAVAAIATALKPGGRLVAEFGGHGNVAAVVTALLAALDAEGIDGTRRHPWTFPTPASFGRLLERVGFTVEKIALVPRPTPLPTGMAGWLDTFANPFLEGLDEAVRATVLEKTLALLRPSLCDEAGTWSADYVRLRVVARLSAA